MLAERRQVSLSGSAERMWEYLQLDLNNTARGEDEIDLLNDAGQDGWELVAIIFPYRAILKRQLPEIASDTVARRTSATVKYRDPATGQTWSGRGRMANWLAAKVQAGEPAEQFLVDP